MWQVSVTALDDTRRVLAGLERSPLRTQGRPPPVLGHCDGWHYAATADHLAQVEPFYSMAAMAKQERCPDCVEGGCHEATLSPTASQALVNRRWAAGSETSGISANGVVRYMTRSLLLTSQPSRNLRLYCGPRHLMGGILPWSTRPLQTSFVATSHRKTGMPSSHTCQRAALRGPVKSHIVSSSTRPLVLKRFFLRASTHCSNQRDTHGRRTRNT